MQYREYSGKFKTCYFGKIQVLLKLVFMELVVLLSTATNWSNIVTTFLGFISLCKVGKLFNLHTHSDQKYIMSTKAWYTNFKAFFLHKQKKRLVSTFIRFF